MSMLHSSSVCRVNGNLGEWKLNNGTMLINECISVDGLRYCNMSSKCVSYISSEVISSSVSLLVTI